ncbi:MAG: hypothetical protein EOO46_22580 [Flavobacterium sp.]|nr:MAG: hypothetical protein EOO46_22580 [Flavobacterium sp.]
MRAIFILSIFLFTGGCIHHVKKDKEKVKVSTLEFSYSDSYEEILSFQLDSNKFYVISINDTIIYGTLIDSTLDRFNRWEETILSNPEKYREIKDCENCAELVIKISSLQDTLVFVKHGQLDNDSKQIIQSTKVLYTEKKDRNTSQANFETRLLIKPKGPKILPVKF